MYIIKSDGFVVHDGFMNDKDYVVISGTMTTEFNRAGTLSFTVPFNNAAYKAGYLKKLVSTIRVYDRKENLKWKGRIIDTSKDFFGNLTCNCEGWLGVLNDSLVRPNGTGGSGGSGGSIVEKAITWMENLANDDTHGYDQGDRWGPDYDCSSAVISAWDQAGVPVKSTSPTDNKADWTGNMYEVFLRYGFQDVTNQVNIYTGEGLIRGDVLLHTLKHTAMYRGNNSEVEASVNEMGATTGGQSGDQTGREILIQPYRSSGSFGTWEYVLRYPQGGGSGEGGSSSGSSVTGTAIKYALDDDKITRLARVFVREQGDDVIGVQACASHLCNRLEMFPIGNLKDPYNYLLYAGWWGPSGDNLKTMNTGSASAAAIQATREAICEGKRNIPLFVTEYDYIGDIGTITNNGVAINKWDRTAYIKDTTKIVNNLPGTSASDVWTFWGFPDGVNGDGDPFGYVKKPEGSIDFAPGEATTGGGSGGQSGEDTITIAPADYFVWLIQNHNEQVDENKRLNVMMPANIFTTPVTFPAANYDNTLDYIQTNFLSNEDVGGRIWVEENNIYFYPDGSEGVSRQPIEFGTNLLDLTENYDASELFTAVIPTGKDGLLLTPTYPVDYIRNEVGIAAYGIIVRHVDFGDIEDPAILYQKAEQLLGRNIEQSFNIEISAFDLSVVNIDAGEVKVGTLVNVHSAPHDIDKGYICTASEVDLTNPSNTKITLGVNLDTLTTKQMKIVRSISNNSGYTADLPSYDINYDIYKSRVDVLDMSFKRSGHAVQLIFKAKIKQIFRDDADGGPIIFTFNTRYTPNLDIRVSSVYNARSKKTYTLEVTKSGLILVYTDGDIRIDDEITGNANWTYT